MDGVVVHRTPDRLPPLEGLDIPDHQPGIEGVRVVVIESGPLLKGHFAVRLIIVVVVEHADMRSKLLLELFGQGGLA